MADKNFGVKKINLIGVSGTPSIDSPNNLNINAINVAISTDLTIGGEINSNVKVGSAYSVGIGTTNPTSKLHVIGDGYFSGSINAESFTGIASTAITAYNLTAAENILSGTISTERLTGEYDIDISGKSKDVIGGIGSLVNLSVSGITTLGNILISSGIITATSGIVTYYGTYYGDGSKLENVTVSGVGISIFKDNIFLGLVTALNFKDYLDVDHSSAFSTVTVNKDAVNYFKFTSAGIHTLSNVGIGTTNPTEKLTVGGAVTATNYYGDGSTLDDVVYIVSEEIVPYTTVDVEINWLDTFGDGWNGGLVDVYVDDVLVIDDFTIPDVGDNITTGISTLTNVSAGSTIRVERVALGDYPEEMTISSIKIIESEENITDLLTNYNFTNAGIETVSVTIPSSYTVTPSTTGVDGEARFNHYTNRLQYHDGTSWKLENEIIVKNGSNLVSQYLTSGGESGTNNIFLGVGVGNSNISGSNNNFFGTCAGYSNTGGSCNNFFGFVAGKYNTTGSSNNFFGRLAGHYNTGGGSNNFIGNCAGWSNTTGSSNNFFGFSVGRLNTTGSCNNFIGNNTGIYNTTGSLNNFIGYLAGQCNTTGCNNNFIGRAAGRCNTTGNHNNFFGYYAGSRVNTNSCYNNFIGYYAGKNITNGNGNNIIGHNAATSATGGCYNNIIGYSAGYKNTTGCNNNFFGYCAGFCNTTGNCNNFFGSFAGYCNTTACYNNFFGPDAGRSNTTGGCNNFIGYLAGYANTTGCNNNFLGFSAGYANTTGRDNNFFGWSAGRYNTSGSFNTFIGNSAGKDNTTGCNNNFLGSAAGFDNTTGSCNNFFGRYAGRNNTTGCYNNFLGFNAGRCNTTGGCNNFLGSDVGCSNSTGSNNNFLGRYAGRYNTTGCDNNFLGSAAGLNNTTGCDNNFFGRDAGCANTTGGCNNFFGPDAGRSNTTGGCNNFIGYQAGFANTTGSYNNFFGFCVGRFNTTGFDNNFFGRLAGYCNTTGSHNNFIGTCAGFNNTTGVCNNFFGCDAGSNNTTGGFNNFFGESAGRFNTTGSFNNFFGSNAGRCNTNGSHNNFMGIRAGRCNTTGRYNNFFGYYAGSNNTTGCDNNFIGNDAGAYNTTGYRNNFIGRQAGLGNTSGFQNISIGDQTASEIGSGTYNIFLGYAAGNLGADGQYNTFIGYYAGGNAGNGSNNIAIGEGAGAQFDIGTNNIAVGTRAGEDEYQGNNNIFLGSYTGNANFTPTNNKIIIGRGFNGSNRFDSPTPTTDTQFAVGVRTDSNPSKYWLVGNENFNIGIGSTTPQHKLDVGGSIKISDKIYDSNNSPGANNYVLTSGGSSGNWSWQELSALGSGNVNILSEGTAVGSFSDLNYAGSNLSVAGSGSTVTIDFSDTPTFDTLNVTGVSTFQGDTTFQSNVYLGDNDKINLGDDNDLQIYHDGLDSWIWEQGPGALYIRSNGGSINLRLNSTDMVVVRENQFVALNYGSSRKFETTGIGISISNGTSDTATITGPTNLIIDPATVGDNTGIVRIKGDLYVDGTTTQINSTTIELSDFIVGIATTATTDLLADGAGIQIGPNNTFLYDYNGGTNSSFKSSEYLNVVANKGYQIDGTMVLNSTSLGVGVTNSSLTTVGILTGLSVNGDVYIQNNNTLYFDSSSNALFYYNQTSNSLQLSLGSNADDFRILDGGLERFRFVKSTGNLGVGLTNPTEKIDVNGNVKAIDFNATSDQNLKDNIQTIEDPIQKINQLRGVTFDWKKDNKPSIGVIAQEVEKVLPELVSGDDTKTVNYNGLIGVLIECVKKQQEEIEILKQKIHKY